MTANANTGFSPLIGLALLATLGLVYWQWSVAPALQTEVVTVRTEKKVPGNLSYKNRMPPAPAGETVIASSVSDSLISKPGLLHRQLPVSRPSKALFSAHEWLPPPIKPPPPPPPETPPVPYQYVGSLQNSPGGDLVILVQHTKMLMPKLGTQIDPQWRLDREDAQAVYLTYLPLNTAVVLSKTRSKSSVDAGQAEPDNNPTEEIPNQ